jgi:hypothetical protein
MSALRVPRPVVLWPVVVIAVFVGLAALILVTTPGPWHRLIPFARAELAKQAPADVLIFANGKAGGDVCAAVLWLHVAYNLPGAAIIVVPPNLIVEGDHGWQLLGRLALREGAAASEALGRVVGVPIGGWMAVDRDALLRSLGSAASLARPVLGDGARGSLTATQLEDEVGAWRLLLALAPRRDLPVAAFENYVLGSGAVHTSLSLQAVASIGRVFRDAPAADVTVVGLPARVSAAGGEPVWRADARGLRRLVYELRQRL